MALNIPTEGTRLNELKINIVDTQETFEAMKTANKVNANELYFIEQESSIAADSLKIGHTFKVNLASSNASSPFTGEQDISDIGVSGTLPITHGGTGATSAASAPWVQKSGDTMTGVLTMKGNMYNDAYDGALNMNNSDIYGLNSIYTGDTSDGAAEGIHFYRDTTHVDTLWVAGGDLLFVPNRAIGTNTTKANSQKISRFTANPTSGQVVVTDGTTGGVKSSGYTIAKSVPSDAVFTDTKNTAGSTDTSSKIYLIGATSQAANPQTYSDNEVFATSGVLTAKTFNSTSLTASQAVSTDANKNLVSTNLTVSDPTASGTGITYIASVSQSATGKISASKSTVRSASTTQTGVTQYTADNLNTWINQLTTGSSTPTDADYYISQYVGGGTTTTTYHRRPMSALWTYIKGKITTGTYWANIKISDAAVYNAAPEIATLKLNGNTSATTASTSNASLVYDSTTQALNFVFA